MRFFLLYLFLEVLLSVQIATAIGGLATFFEILGSALLGGAIIQRSNMKLGENLQKVMHARMSPHELQTAHLFTFIGALLLMVPGMLTDAMGLLLQLPFIARSVATRMERAAQNGERTFTHHQSGYTEFTVKTKPKGESDVIDVEIIDDSRTIDHK